MSIPNFSALSAENPKKAEGIISTEEIMPVAPQSEDGFRGERLNSFGPPASKSFSSELLLKTRKKKSTKKNIKTKKRASTKKQKNKASKKHPAKKTKSASKKSPPKRSRGGKKKARQK